jgi:hypothetical protein
MRAPLEARVSIRGSRQAGLRLPLAPSREPMIRRRGPRSDPAPPASAPVREVVPPVRLRTLLLLAAAGLGVRWFVPRAIGYWQLHAAATEFANYASCMAGPSGPELLWQQPKEFWRLARRRLRAAPAAARPFATCVAASEAFTESSTRAHAQQARAGDYIEYAGLTPPAPDAVSFDQLGIDDSRLKGLVAAAGSLLRKDVRELLRPTLRTRAAPHPAELAVPAEGRGLPAVQLGYAAVSQRDGGYLLVTGRDANLAGYRSWDGGKTWTVTNSDDPTARANAGRCTAGAGDNGFRLTSVGDALHLESWQGGDAVSSVPLLGGDRRLLAFSCDQQAAVALASDEDQRLPITFRFCAHLGRCRDLPVPAELHSLPSAGTALSIARVRGATILSMSRSHVVRVISSRDDGQTWMPAVVAYDSAEYPTPPFGERTPTQLLPLDGRVLLYAGADRPGSTYPVLASDDLGASWHAP